MATISAKLGFGPAACRCARSIVELIEAVRSPRLAADSPRPAARSMIRVLAAGLARRVRREPAQPVGGRLDQAAAQGVDPDHRQVDSRLPEAAQVRAQLRLVPSLEDHFPPSRIRCGTSSEPLPLGVLSPLPLPLSWHRPRITGRLRSGKAIEPRARPRSVIIWHTNSRPRRWSRLRSRLRSRSRSRLRSRLRPRTAPVEACRGVSGLRARGPGSRAAAPVLSQVPPNVRIDGLTRGVRRG